MFRKQFGILRLALEKEHNDLQLEKEHKDLHPMFSIRKGDKSFSPICNLEV